ncbi:elongation of very long chain fatty acids protein 4 [Caerostris darwini]|uniref:Elongation of very long chain fatty acids protein n=1 Tax=Caerostris darwini TaxID=1538125 RepID=A0AAV4TP89_9ARAC|nr:elongation of very long chain fatty acids protein 4 [Caerostris darwini]
MALLESIYDFVFVDPMNKALRTSPIIFPSIIISYVLFVTWIGPAMMKKRKAFDLRIIMVAYDITEVLINGYIAYRLFGLIRQHRYLYCLAKNNPSYSSVVESIIIFGWSVFLNKMVELLDTIFFVLRKKQEQITFLHVAHHSSICILSWILVRNPHQLGGFYIAVGIAINAVVHCVMYIYYALAALGPEVAKHLWWKKYVTIIQMAQFVVDILYLFVGFFTGCEELGKMEITSAAFLIYLLYLFNNFFKKYKQQ